MARVSREEMFMGLANIVARRSTCYRANVGAVAVHEKNVVSMGYNGPPPGEPHCIGQHCLGNMPSGCTLAIHAERNALNRISLSLHGNIELYVTHSPCADCAERIKYFGRPHLNITKLYFQELYRINEHLHNMLHVEIFQIKPAGFILNWKTGELIS